MVEKRYQCDLCRDGISRDPNELHGLYWEYTGWTKRPSYECQRHLCDKCLESITKIGNEYAAMRPLMNKTGA